MTLFLVTHIVRSGPKRYRAEFNLKMKDTKQIFPPTLKLLKIILSCILSKACIGPILGVIIEVNLK